jgi:hypothetical protein
MSAVPADRARRIIGEVWRHRRAAMLAALALLAGCKADAECALP